MAGKKRDLIKSLSTIFSFQDIENITVKALGITSEEFSQKIVKNTNVSKEKTSGRGRSAGGTGNSGRKLITPTADMLEDQWKQTRDVNWLYNHPEYFWEGLACSYATSAPGAASSVPIELCYPHYPAKRKEKRFDITRLEWKIYDWGAGVGLTTIVMAANMPRSTFYFTPTPNSQEAAFFKEALNHCGLKNIVICKEEDVPYDLDMLVAIEIVEHFEEPMKALKPWLQHIKKGGLFAHSSYWDSERKMPTLGHFINYDFGNGLIGNLYKSEKDIYRKWRKAMDLEGWDYLTDWDPFGHKPRFYRRKTDQKDNFIPDNWIFM